LIRPEPIEISAGHADGLRKLNAMRIGNAGFVEQMRVAGERRNAELVQEGAKLWSELATTYNLDVEHVAYDLASDGSNKLVILQAQFAG
jgi:hypothetical protein